MAEYYVSPPEDRLPEETPAPAPGAYPPPAEDAVGYSGPGRRKRGGKTFRRGKNVLLAAAAGAALCGVIAAAPMKPALPAEPTAVTADAGQTAQTAQTDPVPTEPAVLTEAQRLVDAGLWKNTAAEEWVCFYADGTGWWYDGAYFGPMTWTEVPDGGITYEASMAYLSPEREYTYDWAPEKEGDSLHSAKENGSIALQPEEDRFTCPGLRFGEGDFVPDPTPIDASVMENVRGKTAAQLLSGTAWRTAETGDLGIPCAPSGEEKPEIYTDLVYVQRMDFSAGTLRIAARDGGLLQLEQQAGIGMIELGEPASALDLTFTVPADEKAAAYADVGIDAQYVYRSAYVPGNTEYNNMHLLWGHKFGPDPTRVYLLITASGLRLGFKTVDWYPDNYTLLAMD